VPSLPVGEAWLPLAAILGREPDAPERTPLSQTPPQEAPRPIAAAGRAAILRLGAPLLLVAVWLGTLYPGPLLRGETFFARDFLTYDRPLAALQARLWHETRGLPEWDPYLAEGQPFADRPITSPFEPLSWLLLVLPFNTAFNLQVILPPLISLLGMLFLLRALGRSRAAAWFGALAWGFGGCVLSLADLFPMARTAAFIPAMLGFVVRLVRRGRWGDALGFAAALALAALGGEPTGLLAGGVLAAAAAGAALLEPVVATTAPAPPWRGRAARATAAALLGVAMAAAVLLPSARLAGSTVRASSLETSELDTWSLAPPRLLEPLVPHLLGDLDLEKGPVYWGRRWYGEKRSPYLLSLYAGLLTAVLAALAAFGQPRRVGPWLVVAAFGAIAALGAHWRSWYLVREVVGVLLRLRFPEKWALLPAMAAVILASLGFERLVGGDRRFRRRTVITLGALAGALVLASGAVIVLTARGGPVFWERIGVPADLVTAFTSSMPAHLLRQAAVAAAALVAVLALARRRAALSAVLLVLTALDLLPMTRPLLATVPATEVDRVPAFLAPLLASPSPPRLFHQAAWQTPCAFRGDVAEPLTPARWGIPLAFEVDFDLTELRWTSDATDLFFDLTGGAPGMMWPILARRGVGAVLRCSAGAERSAGGDASAPPVELLPVPGDRGLVTCVDRVVRARGGTGWLRAELGLGRAAADSAVVDFGDAGALPDAPSTCRAALVARTPRRLTVRVVSSGPQPSYLAINQTWHPAWSAHLDGRPTRLIRTDVSLSGVVVPPGMHTVDLTFRDRWVERSAWLSAAAWAVWIVAWPALALRRRQAGRERSRRSVQRSWP
jgi:hypothetical protein